MKGKIIMEFDGHKTKIEVKVKGVGLADKCVAVDHLLESLSEDKTEKALICAMVSTVVNSKLEDKEESKDEGRCFRD